MAEAVRFFWLRGEATLPQGAIPDDHRNPLKVCRSLVQSSAPAVIRQLESGRFVAAAWDSGGALSMILCHPNLAKGAFETFLVDTKALPRLVLKLSSWDEAPEISRLFLRAFGSEATDIEECEVARRDLARWLTEHGQSEMARAVNHFMAFPFAVRSDAMEVINIWRHVLVKGQKEQIDRFLEQVGQRFKALGWSRELDFEARLNRDPDQINRFYCWVSGSDNRPHIKLCLNHPTDLQVRGGKYNLMEERASIADLASEIQHVLAEVLEPSAQEVGLVVTYPRLGPISRVEPKTVAAMTALAEAGDGQGPLSEHLAPLWRKFVHTAYREDVAINPDELTAWFIASGWKEDAAIELTNRFYSDVVLIEEYEAAGRQPA